MHGLVLCYRITCLPGKYNFVIKIVNLVSTVFINSYVLAHIVPLQEFDDVRLTWFISSLYFIRCVPTARWIPAYIEDYYFCTSGFRFFIGTCIYIMSWKTHLIDWQSLYLLLLTAWYLKLQISQYCRPTMLSHFSRQLRCTFPMDPSKCQQYCHFLLLY